MIPYNGNQMVAVPGVAEALIPIDPLGTSIKARKIWITAKRLAAVNVGNVFVAGLGLVAGALEAGELAPGDHVTLVALPGESSYDLSTIFVDADNATDGVVFTYWV